MKGRGSQVKEQHSFQINQKVEFLKHHHLVIIPIVSQLRKTWKDSGWRGVFWGQLLQREFSPVREAQNRFWISQLIDVFGFNQHEFAEPSETHWEVTQTGPCSHILCPLSLWVTTRCYHGRLIAAESQHWHTINQSGLDPDSSQFYQATFSVPGSCPSTKVWGC